MSADQHAADAPGHADAVAHHATDDHGDDHGHDDHAHGEEPLGPIDVAAWGAGVLGVAGRPGDRGLLRARDDAARPDRTEPARGLRASERTSEVRPMRHSYSPASRRPARRGPARSGSCSVPRPPAVACSCVGPQPMAAYAGDPEQVIFTGDRRGHPTLAGVPVQRDPLVPGPRPAGDRLARGERVRRRWRVVRDRRCRRPARNGSSSRT